MLVYRAKVRREGGDEEGAREELRAAIEIFPGEEGAGAAPVIGDGSAVFNWQNHLAYLALAVSDAEDGAAFYRRALARSDELSLTDIGARPRDLAEVDPFELDPIAEQILGHNFADDPKCAIPAPSSAQAVLVSPLWDLVEDGNIGRRASLVPAGFRELYYDGDAAEGLRRAGARLAADAVRDALTDPAGLAWRIREARARWMDPDAPVAETIGEPHPAHPLLSSVLVYAGRCFHAGATEEQIAARLRGERDETVSALLEAESAWDTAQYAAAMSMDEMKGEN
jgi:hypothetical protein